MPIHIGPDVCYKCKIYLTDKNWFASRKKRGRRICKRCQTETNKPARLHRETTKRNEIRQFDKKNKNKWRIKARIILGSVCQLCGSSDLLHFAHIKYLNDDPHRSSYRTSLEVIKHPDNFLLLCKDCHFHPEKYLKELLDIKNKYKWLTVVPNAEASVIAPEILTM